MTERSAMFLVMVGLLTTGFGVGGVENSVDNLELLSGLLVSVSGLAIMAAGVLGLKTVDNKSN